MCGLPPGDLRGARAEHPRRRVQGRRGPGRDAELPTRELHPLPHPPPRRRDRPRHGPDRAPSRPRGGEHLHVVPREGGVRLREVPRRTGVQGRLRRARRDGRGLRDLPPHRGHARAVGARRAREARGQRLHRLPHADRRASRRGGHAAAARARARLPGVAQRGPAAAGVLLRRADRGRRGGGDAGQRRGRTQLPDGDDPARGRVAGRRARRAGQGGRARPRVHRLPLPRPEEPADPAADSAALGQVPRAARPPAVGPGDRRVLAVLQGLPPGRRRPPDALAPARVADPPLLRRRRRRAPWRATQGADRPSRGLARGRRAPRRPCQVRAPRTRGPRGADSGGVHRRRPRAPRRDPRVPRPRRARESAESVSWPSAHAPSPPSSRRSATGATRRAIRPWASSRRSAPRPSPRSSPRSETRGSTSATTPASSSLA